MTDRFKPQYAGDAGAVDWPADRWAEITPDDDNDLASVPRAVYVGVSGDLAIVGDDGVAVTFTNVPVGILPVRPRRVKDAGTTAEGLVALE